MQRAVLALDERAGGVRLRDRARERLVVASCRRPTVHARLEDRRQVLAELERLRELRSRAGRCRRSRFDDARADAPGREIVGVAQRIVRGRVEPILDRVQEVESGVAPEEVQVFHGLHDESVPVKVTLPVRCTRESDFTGAADDMSSLLLALVASAGWGVSDFLGGVAAGRARVLIVLAGSQVAGLLAFAPVLLAHAPTAPRDGRLLYAVLAGGTGIAELALIYVALERGSSVVMAPIAALGAVVPVVVGLASGDRLDLLIASGIACALVGAAAAAVAPGAQRSTSHAALIGSAIAGGAAICTGAGLLLVDAASAADPWWAIGSLHVSGTVVAVTVLVVASRRSLLVVPSHVPWRLALAIAAIGLTDVAAGIAYATATRSGSLSEVSVLASLYPVVTIALGVLTCGERPGRVQFAGALLALTGVAILASSSG